MGSRAGLDDDTREAGSSECSQLMANSRCHASAATFSENLALVVDYAKTGAFHADV